MVREMTEKSGQYFSCIFHNGFRFDITFLTKALWVSLWPAQDIFPLGSGLTSLKSYSLGHQVKFIDSVKYHQQPLAKLAGNTDKNEKKRIHSLFCSNYLAYVQVYYSQSFLSLPKEDIEFVLEYLSLSFHSLSAVPEDGDFWDIESFYSRMRDEDISQKELEGCKKLCKMLKMRNLSDFNDIYNIQDVIILAVILEYRWQKIKENTGFDPRRFTSASTLSGTIERIKSRVILTYPRNVEIVDHIESLLSRGYSSVHTRLGFSEEMFTPKIPKYIKEKMRSLSK